MVKVIGYEKKKGTFINEKTGDLIDYDNINLHTITDEYKNIVGFSSSVLKIKSKDFEGITGFKSPDELLDKEVTLGYIPVAGGAKLSSIKIVD